VEIKGRSVRVRRKIDGGYEILDCVMPVLITVLKDAAEPRPFSAKRVMAFKGAKSLLELEKMAEGNSLLYIDKLVFEYKNRSLFIPTLTADDLNIDPARCGVKGSPTKVYAVESVVLAGNDPVQVENSRTGMNSLIEKLMEDRILG
jgi:electron transfer flavoprotein beta subunit